MRASFSTWVIVSLVGGLLLGLAFAGGVAWGRGSAPETVVTVQAQPAPAAASAAEGTRPSRDTAPPAAAASQPVVRGTIAKVDGDIIEVTTASGSVAVKVGSDTTIRRLVAGGITDVSPGQTIQVQGRSNPDGSVVATSIQLSPTDGSRPGTGGRP